MTHKLHDFNKIEYKQRIEQHIADRHMTQGQFAESIGITDGPLSNMLNGKRALTEAWAMRILLAHGLIAFRSMFPDVNIKA